MPFEPEKYLGRVVEVKFLDHIKATGVPADPLLCTVWGRFVKDDWQSIQVQTWATEDEEDSFNVEYITIVRAAVTSIRPLKYDIGEK